MKDQIVVSSPINGVSVISVGKVQLVAGLFWRILTKPRAYMSEARAFAKSERERTGIPMDVVAVRNTGEVIQAGFVSRGCGAVKGMYSVATVAADVLGKSFIAAFRLGEDQYVTVAVLNGSIIPESDAISTCKQAREKLEELYSILSGSFQDGALRVIAPPEVISTGAEEVTFDVLLSALKRAQRLRQLSWFSKQELLLAAGGLVVVVAAITAYSLYAQHQAELARVEEAERAARLARLRAESERPVEEIALQHPWTQTPTTQSFLTACTSSLAEIPITLDGWILKRATCSANATTSEYVRAIGRTALGFRSAAQEWNSNATARMSPDGSTGSIVQTFAIPPGGDDELAAASERLEAFYTHFQQRLVSVSVQPKQSYEAAIALRPGQVLKQPRVLDWATYGWTVVPTERTPASFLADMPSLGVRISEIALEHTESKILWTVHGEIYGS